MLALGNVDPRIHFAIPATSSTPMPRNRPRPTDSAAARAGIERLNRRLALTRRIAFFCFTCAAVECAEHAWMG